MTLQKECCKECSESKFALKGKNKERFNGICGLACECHLRHWEEGSHSSTETWRERLKELLYNFAVVAYLVTEENHPASELDAEHKKVESFFEKELLSLAVTVENKMKMYAAVINPDEAIETIQRSIFGVNPPDYSSSKMEALGRIKAYDELRKILTSKATGI